MTDDTMGHVQDPTVVCSEPNGANRKGHLDATANVADMPKRGTVLAGRYEVQELLGMSAMSVVFGAVDKARAAICPTAANVAIKILRPGMDDLPTRAAELRNEFINGTSLSSRHVVRTLDIGFDAPWHFLATEKLHGAGLGKVLANSGGILSAERALNLSIQLFEALDDSHSAGVVHGDIKPDNIFITNNKPLKLIDFGASHRMAVTDELKNPLPEALLTPAYASIARLNGQRPSPEDDCFASACVVYKMLTGNGPFGDLTAHQAQLNSSAAAPLLALPRPARRVLQQALCLRFDRPAITAKEVLAGLRKPLNRKRNTRLAAGLLGAAVLTSALVIPSDLRPAASQKVLLKLAGKTPQAELPKQLTGPISIAIDELSGLRELPQDDALPLLSAITDRFQRRLESAISQDVKGAVALNRLHFALTESSTHRDNESASEQLSLAVNAEQWARVETLRKQFKQVLKGGELLTGQHSLATQYIAIVSVLTPANAEPWKQRLESAAFSEWRAIENSAQKLRATAVLDYLYPAEQRFSHELSQHIKATAVVNPLTPTLASTVPLKARSAWSPNSAVATYTTEVIPAVDTTPPMVATITEHQAAKLARLSDEQLQQALTRAKKLATRARFTNALKLLSPLTTSFPNHDELHSEIYRLKGEREYYRLRKTMQRSNRLSIARFRNAAEKAFGSYPDFYTQYSDEIVELAQSKLIELAGVDDQQFSQWQTVFKQYLGNRPELDIQVSLTTASLGLKPAPAWVAE